MANFLRAKSTKYDVDQEFDHPTVAALQAATGNYVIAIYSYRSASGNQTSTPEFNGQSLAQIFSDKTFPIDAEECRVSFYGGFVESGGTFDLIGNANAYIACNVIAMVVADVNPDDALSDLMMTFGWDESSWVQPELIQSDVASGDVVIDVLAAILWDSDYIAHPEVEWNAEAQTPVAAVSNSFNQIGNLVASRSAGVGDLSVGYSASEYQPGYAYFSFVVKGLGSGIVITDIDDPVRVGAVISIETTGLGDLTVASSVGGKAVVAANAPGGSGTLTIASFVNGQSFPAMEMEVAFIARDATKSSDAYPVNLDTMMGWQYVNVANVNTGPWSLGQAITGDTVITQAHVINDDVGVLNDDLTLSDWKLGNYIAWLRDDDGIMHLLNFTVTSSGVSAAGFIGFIEPIGFFS